MALGIEQRLADHPFDGRDARHDDPAPAQLIKQQPRQCCAVGRRQRGRQEPRLKLCPDWPGEGLEAEHIAQRVELLVAGLRAGVEDEVFADEAELVGDEVEVGVLERPDGTIAASVPAKLNGTEDSAEGFYGFETKYLEEGVTATIPAPYSDELTGAPTTGSTTCPPCVCPARVRSTGRVICGK